MQNIKSIYLRRVRKHFFQQLGSQKVVAPGTVVMIVTSLGMRESLEDAKSGLRVSQSEPRSCQWLFIDTLVDVSQKPCHQIFFAGLCFKVNVVGFVSGSIVYAVDEEPWVDGVI